MSDNVAGKIHSQAVVDPGEGSGEPVAPPPSFLDQTGSQAGSLLSPGLEAPPPTPPSEGLDLPLSG